MTPHRAVFIKTAASTLPVTPELETYTWLDPNIPTLLGAESIVVEVPPDAELDAGLFRELQLAGESGTQVVWFITGTSSAQALRTLLSAEPFALRGPGSSASLKIIDEGFRQFFPAVDSFHFVFQPPPGFRTIAAVGDSTLAAAALTEKDNSGSIVLLPHPSSSAGQSLTILLAALARLRRATDRQADPVRAIRSSVTAVALLVCLIIGLRLFYRDLNQRILAEHPGSDAAAAGPITPLDIDPEGPVLSLIPADESLKALLRLTPRELLARDDHADVLKLYNYLHLERLESAAANALQERRKSGDSSQAAKADKELASYASMLEEAMLRWLVNGDYQTARLQAHKLLAVAYDLRDPQAKVDALEHLREAHAVISLVKDNYLYHDPSFVAAAVNDALLHKHTRFDTVKLSAKPTDPTLQDDLEYFRCAFVTPNQVWPVEKDCWQTFLVSFPSSPRRLEAAFNIVRSHFFGALRMKINAPGESTVALQECEEFLRQFPRSYLSDDVMLYELKAATIVPDDQAVWKAFVEISNYAAEGTDAYARLLVQVSSRAPLVGTVAALRALLGAAATEPDTDLAWYVANRVPKDSQAEVLSEVERAAGIVGERQARAPAPKKTLKDAATVLIETGPWLSWSPKSDKDEPEEDGT